MFFVSWPLYYIRYLIPISGKLCCVLTCYYRQKYKYDYPLFTNVVDKNITTAFNYINLNLNVKIKIHYIYYIYNRSCPMLLPELYHCIHFMNIKEIYLRKLVFASHALICTQWKAKHYFILYTRLYSILKNILLKISPLNWKVHIMILTSYLNSNISNITEVIDQNKRK